MYITQSVHCDASYEYEIKQTKMFQHLGQLHLNSLCISTHSVYILSFTIINYHGNNQKWSLY